MSEFFAELRAQVDEAARALDQAQRSDGDQVHRYGARLLDLLDRAAAYGVDTTGWVTADLLALASTAAGNQS